MERVHIDLLGPLPKTAAGNEHILMMVDQFTKWMEIIALPSQTAENCPCGSKRVLHEVRLPFPPILGPGPKF